MKIQNGFKFLLLLLLVVTLGQFKNSSASAVSSSCTPNPESDLSGVLDETNRGTITNSSTDCSYDVGIVSYQKFNDIVADQQIFDSFVTE